MFKNYKRKAIAQLNMGRVSISDSDKENGSPMYGDMIARNPEDHEDQWLVAFQYFKDNFEMVSI
jgi:hypothetical protein